MRKVGGYVDQLLVDIGDRVTGPVRDSDGKIRQAGQLLAVLSAPELEQELRQKEAMVEQVRAEVQQSEAAINVAISVQLSARAGVKECVAGQQRAMAQFERWKSEFARMQTLAEADRDRVIEVPESDAALVENGRPAKIIVSAMGKADHSEQMLTLRPKSSGGIRSGTHP